MSDLSSAIFFINFLSPTAKLVSPSQSKNFLDIVDYCSIFHWPKLPFPRQIKKMRSWCAIVICIWNVVIIASPTPQRNCWFPSTCLPAHGQAYHGILQVSYISSVQDSVCCFHTAVINWWDSSFTTSTETSWISDKLLKQKIFFQDAFTTATTSPHLNIVHQCEARGAM